jgi:hypothetical protein
MYHKLRFRDHYEIDLQVPGKGRLEQLVVQKNEVIEAQVQPLIVETEQGPVEAAHLHLPGDGTLLFVPMECFEFI